MTMRLIVDSGCWLPRELLVARNIIEVPVYLVSREKTPPDATVTTEEVARRLKNVGYEKTDVPLKTIVERWRRGEYLDIEVSLEELIAWQKQGRKFGTSAFSPGEAAEAFTKAIDKGANELLVLSLTASDSVVYDAFNKAAEMVRKTRPRARIEVMDSFTTSMAHGLLALEVAELMSTGLNFDQVVETAQSRRRQMLMMAALATVKFVAEGGRASSIQTFAGSLLGIKPTVVIVPGEKVSVHGKHRTMRVACEVMVETIAKHCSENRERCKLAVVHTDDVDKAKEVQDMLAKRLTIPVEKIMLTDASKVLVVHAGPGAVGVAADCGQRVIWK